MESSYSYQAFISYSHKDKKVAKQLFKALEHLKVPKGIQIPKVKRQRKRKLGRFFRDEDELSTSVHLPDKIEQSLMSSRALIVLCSKYSSKSEWVENEISFFLKHGKHENIICVLVGDENSEPEFPGIFRKNGMEPLAADYRGQAKETKREAIIKIAAALCEVGYDEFRRRDLLRARQAAFRNGILAFGATILAVAAIASSIIAFGLNGRLQSSLIAESQARGEAVKARDLANAARIKAEETLAREIAANKAADTLAEVAGVEADKVSRNLAALGTIVDYWIPVNPESIQVSDFGFNPEDVNLQSMLFEEIQLEGGGVRRTNSTIRLYPNSSAEPLAHSDLSRDMRSEAEMEFFSKCSVILEPTPSSLGWRACEKGKAGSLEYDESEYSGEVQFAIDRIIGIAMFADISYGSCGSGGCTVQVEIWRRSESGKYQVIDTVYADSLHVIVHDNDYLEVVTNDYHSMGVSSESRLSTRYQFDQDSRSLRRLLSYSVKREDRWAVDVGDRSVPLKIEVCFREGADYLPSDC